MRRLEQALRCEPVDRAPVWIMRQAGRYLPEYRHLRTRHAFQEAVSTPSVAAEITMQPIRRFAMDGAVIFADIMTPLEAMGVDMTFEPGPRLRPHSLAEVASLGELLEDRVSFVASTVERVRDACPDDTSVIGFAGGPVTLLAYLIEGGGSKQFMAFRGAIRSEPDLASEALSTLSRAMSAYLRLQVGAGADVIQLFDSWAGLLDRSAFEALAVPAARAALSGVEAPTIYFAPGAGHTLDLQATVGADGYGVDWRIPIEDAWERIGSGAIQGNVDPSVLLATPDATTDAVDDVLRRVGTRPGHIVNLGHGIDRRTPPQNVEVMIDRVRNFDRTGSGAA